MIHDVEFHTLLLYAIFLSATANYDPHADSILFHVRWPGKIRSEFPPVDTAQDENALDMLTVDNEKYRCFLPKDAKGKYSQNEFVYDGPSPRELIDPLFTMSSCSYRIESYWTYELCHGKHLRQYHEEKEPGKPSKLQQYFLGYYSLADQSSPEEEDKKKVQTVKVEGHEFPYFAINMTAGTTCDLTNKGRRTTLAYICQPEGKGEIYEIKEVSTCEYQVVVFTKQLCSHPEYKQKSSFINSIACHAVDGAPKRPKNLDILELESAQGRYTRNFLQTEDGTIYIVKRNEDEDFDEISDHFDNDPDDTYDEDLAGSEENQFQQNTDGTTPPPTSPPQTTENKKGMEEPVVAHAPSSQAGKQLLRDFLNGDYCLTGSGGWWKHEFCFKKHVAQYHDGKTGREIIKLGHWSEEEHTQWLNKNPDKRPKPAEKRRYVSNFYGNGDFCELTGSPRKTEVKLRCKEEPSRPTAMSIYLSEEVKCEYVLVVESPILCSLIEEADEDGLFV